MFTGMAIGEAGVMLAKAARPFAVSHVAQFKQHVARGRYPDLRLDMPAIVDLREVDFASISTSDVSRYVTRRASLTAAPAAGPLAVVCSDTVAIGMVRMFGILAELSGLRREEDFHITGDLDDAAEFIAGKIGCDEAARGRLKAKVRDVASQIA